MKTPILTIAALGAAGALASAAVLFFGPDSRKEKGHRTPHVEDIVKDCDRLISEITSDLAHAA